MNGSGHSTASAWLLVRGTGERPLPERVGPESLRAHSSTRRPAVQRGDVAVCYASVWQVIFALVEVVSDPDYDPARAAQRPGAHLSHARDTSHPRVGGREGGSARARWGWRFEIRPLLVVPNLREAPPVEACGVFPRSLGRHSYIRLTREQLAAARDALQPWSSR